MPGFDAFGVVLEREETVGGEDYLPIANLTTLSGPGISREAIEVTAHNSPDQWDEYVPGIKRSGEVSCDANWDPAEHDGILEGDFSVRTARGYRIVWPDPLETTWTFKAFLTGYEPDAPHDDKLSASLTFKLTGVPTFVSDES